MKIRTYHVLVAASLVMASCSDTIEENGGNNGPSLPPVESNAANTNYQPAFAGQTRANGAKTSTPYVSEVVTSALASPWGITALPDGRLLITEKAGTMRIVSSTGNLKQCHYRASFRKFRRTGRIAWTLCRSAVYFQQNGVLGFL